MREAGSDGVNALLATRGALFPLFSRIISGFGTLSNLMLCIFMSERAHHQIRAVRRNWRGSWEQHGYADLLAKRRHVMATPRNLAP